MSNIKLTKKYLKFISDFSNTLILYRCDDQVLGQFQEMTLDLIYDIKESMPPEVESPRPIPEMVSAKLLTYLVYIVAKDISYFRSRAVTAKNIYTYLGIEGYDGNPEIYNKGLKVTPRIKRHINKFNNDCLFLKLCKVEWDTQRHELDFAEIKDFR